MALVLTSTKCKAISIFNKLNNIANQIGLHGIYITNEYPARSNIEKLSRRCDFVIGTIGRLLLLRRIGMIDFSKVLFLALEDGMFFSQKDSSKDLETFLAMSNPLSQNYVAGGNSIWKNNYPFLKK